MAHPTLDRYNELMADASAVPDDQWFDHWNNLKNLWNTQGGETDRVIATIETLIDYYLACEDEGGDEESCRFASTLNLDEVALGMDEDGDE